ncbi:MAG: hypothetical protein KBD63_07835 [Bacteriovoracaceae bacterium]|nr:hypothetical protein [Bacteriovoracaceae bacterium]
MTKKPETVTKEYNLNDLRSPIMVSKTKATKARRKNKKSKVGTKRKAANRNKGSTPKFPINPNE